MFWNNSTGLIPGLVGFSALAILIMAAVVLGRNPQRFDNRAFFGLVLLSIASNLTAGVLFLGDIRLPVPQPQLNYLIGLGGFTLYALMIFARSFPSDEPPGRPLLWGGAGVALVHFLGITLLTPGVFVRTLSSLYLMGSAGLVIHFVWRNIQGSRTREERRGILIVQAAILSRMVISGAAMAVTQAGTMPVYALRVLHVIIAPPVVVAVIGYGLLHFQSMGVRLFLSRSLAYFGVSVMAVLLYVSAISGVQLTLQNWTGETAISPVATPILLVLLLLAFHPIRLAAEKRLERWFARAQVNAQAAVSAYFERTRNVLAVESLHAEVRRATQVVVPGSRLAFVMLEPSPRLMTLDGLEFFLPKDSAPGEGLETAGGVVGDVREGIWETLPLPEVGSLQGFFAEKHRTHYLSRGPGEGEGPPAAMQHLVADLIIPFSREDSLSGVMLLRGGLLAGERVDLLVNLARHLGLQLENAMLYQRALEANEALTVSNRELGHTREFLEQLFEAVPVGIVVLDEERRVVRWNRGMERITKLSRAHAEAAPSLETLLPELSQRGFEAAADRGLTTPIQRQISLGKEASEAIVHLRLALFRDPVSQKPRTVLILTDITEQVRLQADLERNKRLAALGQFAAAMAHEIRTPMTSIQMNVQILAGKVTLPPEDYEYFDIVLTEIRRLNRTVGEVLDFARPMQLVETDVDLGELAEEVVRGMYFLMAEREVAVAMKVPPGLIARADAERLKQVMINLLDNGSHAIQEKGIHSEEGEARGTITVSGRRTTGRAGLPGVQLEVTDDGVGMTSEQCVHAFDPFVTSRPAGTGLGLAISRKIAEAHHGELAAESMVGRGSTFRVWLPAG